MALYKPIAPRPRFIAVDLERQLLPGTIEHELNHLIDHELDLSGFDARYRNNLSGAPAMLLKVVLFANSRGLVSSRGIERAYRSVRSGGTWPRIRLEAEPGAVGAGVSASRCRHASAEFQFIE